MTDEPEPIWQFVADVLRQREQAGDTPATPKRIHGVVESVCDVCGQAVDSDAHLNHCHE